MTLRSSANLDSTDKVLPADSMKNHTERISGIAGYGDLVNSRTIASCNFPTGLLRGFKIDGKRVFRNLVKSFLEPPEDRDGLGALLSSSEVCRLWIKEERY